MENHDKKFMNIDLAKTLAGVVKQEQKAGRKRASQTDVPQLKEAVPVEITADLPSGPNSSIELKSGDILEEVSEETQPQPRKRRTTSSTGIRVFRRDRKSYESMPLINEECERLEQQILAEERQDIPVVPSQLEVDGKTGEMAVQNKFPMTYRAVQALANFTADAGSHYLAGLHLNKQYDLLAANMNQLFPQAVRVDQFATNKVRKEDPNAPEVIVPIEFKLRTRKKSDGTREIFTAVGPSYEEHDINKIARQVIDAAGASARGTVRYDGYKATIDIIFDTEIPGSNDEEIFKPGVRIKAADDGSGAITIKPLMWRNLGLNLFVIGQSTHVKLRRRHMGTGIDEDVATGIETALKSVKGFKGRWDEAYKEDVYERYGYQNPAQIFTELAEDRTIHAVGFNTEELVTRLVSAWYTEPGPTKAHFLCAITKACHLYEWRREDTTDLLEERAGDLLYAKTWNIHHHKVN